MFSDSQVSVTQVQVFDHAVDRSVGVELIVRDSDSQIVMVCPGVPRRNNVNNVVSCRPVQCSIVLYRSCTFSPPLPFSTAFTFSRATTFVPATTYVQIPRLTDRTYHPADDHVPS